MRKSENRESKENKGCKEHQTEEYLLSLLRCGLHGSRPERKPDVCSWEDVWKLAKRNNVDNTISPVLRSYPYELPEKLGTVWKAEDRRTLHRVLQFEVEREQILRQMEEKGISYLPLKGILLAEYYPKPGMRWMCDNDIFYGYTEFDAASGVWRSRGKDENEKQMWSRRASDELLQIMRNLGYQTEQRGGCHDVYKKKPIFNFEMHQRLVPTHSPAFSYYEDPWRFAEPIKEGSHHFRFSDENEYIFQIVHGHKHFQTSGCGIRTLMDEYVMLEKKQGMDWTYIHRELKKTGLDTYEKKIHKTAEDVFAVDGITDQEDWDMIHYMFGSGTYGTFQNRIEGKLKEIQEQGERMPRQIRWQYIKERCWPEETFVREYYPFFYRHRWLCFFLPCYRIIKGMILHPGKLVSEWKILKRKTKDRKERKHVCG